MTTPVLLLNTVVDGVGPCVLHALAGTDGAAGTVRLTITTSFAEAPYLVLTTGLTVPGGAPATDAATFEGLCARLDAHWVEMLARAAHQSTQTAIAAMSAEQRALLRAKAFVDTLLQP